MFWKRSARPRLTPPQGLGEKDIATESSICTGETLIGFREPGTGKLLQAVAVRSFEEICDFYRSYGFDPQARQQG